MRKSRPARPVADGTGSGFNACVVSFIGIHSLAGVSGAEGVNVHGDTSATLILSWLLTESHTE